MPAWSFAIRRTGYAVPSGATAVADMSLIKNGPNQNVTFTLINATTGAVITGAAGTIVGFIAKDGVQASAAGTFSEVLDGSSVGHGQYNYAFPTAETNANIIGLLVTAPNALPENLVFMTSGLHRGLASQHWPFLMMSAAGVADPSASPSVFITKDNGTQAAGAGNVTNLGNGQFDYAFTTGDTNGVVNVSILATAAGDEPMNASIYTVA